MKTERRFEYDLIRFLAMVAVVLFHFNYALFLQNVTGDFIFLFAGKNITLGQYGTILFFMLGGCVSCLSYDSCQTDAALLKASSRYYLKRFLAMMPPFYIAYFMAYCFMASPLSILKGNFIYTILGVDGYLSLSGIETSYVLGEWFLGAILILYLLFPFLYTLIKKYPCVMACILVAYYIVLIQIYPFVRLIDATVAYHIIAFSFGIYCARYGHKITGVVAAAGFVLTVLSFAIKIPVNNAYVQVLQGAGSFVALLYVGRKLHNADCKGMRAFRFVISACAKYSYAVFLVHHVLINRIVAPFANMECSWLWYMMIVLATAVIIAVFAIIIYGANSHLVYLIRKIPAYVKRSK